MGFIITYSQGVALGWFIHPLSGVWSLAPSPIQGVLLIEAFALLQRQESKELHPVLVKEADCVLAKFDFVCVARIVMFPHGLAVAWVEPVDAHSSRAHRF